MDARRRGWLRRFAFGGAAVVLTGWLAALAAVVLVGRTDHRAPADAIIVLGAAQYAGRPSPVLRARLDHGAELWRARVAPVLILTGGVGAGDTTSEAEAGRRYLLSAGIPDSVILLERAGRTTGESMRAAARILHDRRGSSAVLVSDPFHALRARILAFRHGIRASTSPRRTSPAERSVWKQWRYVLAETIKLPVAVLFPNE